MVNFRDLYRRNVYGIMGTLIFHILLFASFWMTERNLSVIQEPEESVLLDFIPLEKKDIEPAEEKIETQRTDKEGLRSERIGTFSNEAVNDAATKDKFFDKSFQKEVDDARKLVSDVNTQLSKKAPSQKQLNMPAVTTAGMDRDSIRNVVYSGKSNIHYFLENRYHLRLPVPIYLAKGGGQVVVDIQVNREGKVVRADARASGRLEDPDLPQYAVAAAEQTLFNAEPKAPAIQKGTITYNFVPQ